MAFMLLWIVAVVGLILTFFYKSTGQSGNAVWGAAAFGLIVGGIYSLIRSDISGIAYGIPIGAIVGMVIQAPELIDRKRGADIDAKDDTSKPTPRRRGRPSRPETITGTRMRVDWQRMISGYNIELPRLPANHTDSLRLGNGDIGAEVYAVP